MSPLYKFNRPDKRIFLEELERTLAGMSNDEARAIATILYYSGARISEALALTPEAIRDLGDKLQITFITLKREKRRKQCPECERKVVHYIPSKKEYRCNICGARGFTPIVKYESISQHNRVLTFDKNLPFFDNFWKFFILRYRKEKLFLMARETFQVHLKRANPNLSAHSFRHNVGRTLDESNISITKIQAILGHANISTTQRYVEGSAFQTKDIQKAHETMKKTTRL